MIPLVLSFIFEGWVDGGRVGGDSDGRCKLDGQNNTLFCIAFAIEKEEWNPSATHWTNQIERSLMKCGTFQNSTFQLALILYSM
ncbi:MAG TPA: hypothetical protein VKA40_09750 [Nitrososphaera sp.]|nr:hypothetical protein [Nitrososphaera sp.]